MLYKVTRCAGCVSANTRPHHGVTELLSHEQNAVRWLALFKRLVETPWKHCLFVQLSFSWRSYIAINCHMLLVRNVRVCAHLLPSLRKSLLALKDTGSNTIIILTSAVLSMARVGMFKHQIVSNPTSWGRVSVYTNPVYRVLLQFPVHSVRG